MSRFRQNVLITLAIIAVLVIVRVVHAQTTPTPIMVCGIALVQPGDIVCAQRFYRVPKGTDLVRTRGPDGLGGPQQWQPLNKLSGQSWVWDPSNRWVRLASTGNAAVPP